MAGRLPARGRRHRGRALSDQARPRRRLHGASPSRRCRRDPLGHRDGRGRSRHSRLAGGRHLRRLDNRDRSHRSRGPGVVARASQAGREDDAARSGSVPVPALHGRGLRAAVAADHVGRRHDRAPDFPADDVGVQRAGSGTVAGPSFSEHVWSGLARRTEGGQSAPEHHRPDRVRSRHAGHGPDHPDRAPSGQWLGALRSVADHRLGARVCSYRSSTTTRCPRSRRSGSARQPG